MKGLGNNSYQETGLLQTGLGEILKSHPHLFLLCLYVQGVSINIGVKARLENRH